MLPTARNAAGRCGRNPWFSRRLMETMPSRRRPGEPARRRSLLAHEGVDDRSEAVRREAKSEQGQSPEESRVAEVGGLRVDRVGKDLEALAEGRFEFRECVEPVDLGEDVAFLPGRL